MTSQILKIFTNQKTKRSKEWKIISHTEKLKLKSQAHPSGENVILTNPNVTRQRVRPPACLHEPPALSGLAPNERTDGFLGDLHTDLEQDVSKLPGSAWCPAASVGCNDISCSPRGGEHEGQSIKWMRRSKNCLHSHGRNKLLEVQAA